MTEPNTNIPKGKQTALGLYVTAKEAWEKWKVEPEKVKILDVRTPEEYLFVGHPTMAWKIPIAISELRVGCHQGKVSHEAPPRFRLPGEGSGQAR